MTATPYRTLNAGPLSMLFEDGGLRYVRLGEVEVLRRIYVAVRDETWATVPMVVSHVSVAEAEGGFVVSFQARHQAGPVHFRWQGQISGDARGGIRFEMDGEVLSPFRRNRIGLCVLQSVDMWAGKGFSVGHVDGSTQEGTFPELIAPHQPALGIRRFAWDVPDGARATLSFEGDVFEMEDQRNWSDNSYKIYSTPQTLPKPVLVTAGTRVRQVVTLALSGGGGDPVARKTTDGIHFDLRGGAASALPVLGTCLAPGGKTLSARAIDRLRALHLGQVRIDVVPSLAGWDARLVQAADGARQLGVNLEVGVGLGGNLDSSVTEATARFAAKFKTLRCPVRSVFVLPLSGDATTAPVVRHVRETLRAIDPKITVGGGTTLFFTEINRYRDVVESFDEICFPNSPQAHMDDDRTVVENSAALPWIAKTARLFAGLRPLVLSPVSLKLPAWPPGEGATDPRQVSLLGAGWTAVHVGYAARAGIARANYFEAEGPCGLIPGAEEGVFPLYHALGAIGEFAGGEVLDSASTRPLSVDGLVLRSAGRTRVILANFEGTVSKVILGPELKAAGSCVELAPFEMATIDCEG